MICVRMVSSLVVRVHLPLNWTGALICECLACDVSRRQLLTAMDFIIAVLVTGRRRQVFKKMVHPMRLGSRQEKREEGDDSQRTERS